MAQYISNTRYMQNPPILSLPATQVIMPRISKLVKLDKNLQSETQQNKRFVRNSAKLLNNLCLKLQQAQFQTIQIKNANDMQKKFKQLKSKMHLNLQKQSVDKIFNHTNENEKLNIKQILKMRPQKIQLQKKYSNKIFIKMEAFKQAEQINRMKQKYNHWYDNVKNDRINSPIFKKVNYLLERAQKQNILQELNIKSPLNNITRNPLKQLNLSKQYQSHPNSIQTRNHSPYVKRIIKQKHIKQKFSIFDV